MAEREYNDPGILGRLFPYFNKDIGKTVDTSVEAKTNQQEPIKSRAGVGAGAGADPTLVKAGVDLLSNYLSKDKTQSIPSQIPQMPQQYDTSLYRALDIIGAGIARRPTQEGYFNQLEKMQNARLEDAYNRRTDTDEAKNLQGLVKQTFPNLSDDIVSKISPDYFSKNYPLLAQMAEKSTNIQNKMAKDQTAKENFKIKYQGVIPDDQLASIIPSITADNLDVYDKRFSKDLEEEKTSQAKIKSDQEAREKWKAVFPKAKQSEINTINANNFDSRYKEERELQKQKELKSFEAGLNARYKKLSESEKQEKTDKKFKTDVLDHFDAISQLETAKAYVDKLDRSRFGAYFGDWDEDTIATAASIDKLAAPQVKALAGPGAITDTERALFKPFLISSSDRVELANKKFEQSMSDAISNGIKKITIAYKTKMVNDNDYAEYMKKYADLAEKYKVKIQK